MANKRTPFTIGSNVSAVVYAHSFTPTEILTLSTDSYRRLPHLSAYIGMRARMQLLPTGGFVFLYGPAAGSPGHAWIAFDDHAQVVTWWESDKEKLNSSPQ